MMRLGFTVAALRHSSHSNSRVRYARASCKSLPSRRRPHLLQYSICTVDPQNQADNNAFARLCDPCILTRSCTLWRPAIPGFTRKTSQRFQYTTRGDNYTRVSRGPSGAHPFGIQKGKGGRTAPNVWIFAQERKESVAAEAAICV